MLINELNVYADDKLSTYKSYIKDKDKQEILAAYSFDGGKDNYCVEQILSDILVASMFVSRSEFDYFYMIDNGVGDCIIYDNFIAIIGSIIHSEFMVHLRNDISSGYSINLIQPMLKDNIDIIHKFTGKPIHLYYEDDEWPFTTDAPEYSTLILSENPKIVVYLSPDTKAIGMIKR
jgi:hypothetical protein